MSPLLHTFESPGHLALRFELGSANVDLATSSAATTTEIAIRPDGRDGEARAAAITVTAHELGDRLEIRIAEPRRSRKRFSRSADVTISVRCPEGVAVECTSGSSDIEARGVLGEVGIKTASGDVGVDDVQGGCRVASASGDIRLRTAQGDTVVSTASGDVVVREALADLSVNTVSGSISVTAAHQGVSSHSVSGDIEIESVDGGAVRLQSVSGDVVVGIAPGQSLWLDIASVSGNTTSDLDVGDADVVGAEGAPVEVRVRTVSGDVRLRRGAPV
jgi:DUF4097 and DUF4098 domain-containing protein YvlB